MSLAARLASSRLKVNELQDFFNRFRNISPQDLPLDTTEGLSLSIGISIKTHVGSGSAGGSRSHRHEIVVNDILYIPFNIPDGPSTTSVLPSWTRQDLVDNGSHLLMIVTDVQPAFVSVGHIATVGGHLINALDPGEVISLSPRDKYLVMQGPMVSLAFKPEIDAYHLLLHPPVNVPAPMIPAVAHPVAQPGPPIFHVVNPPHASATQLSGSSAFNSAWPIYDQLNMLQAYPTKLPGDILTPDAFQQDKVLGLVEAAENFSGGLDGEISPLSLQQRTAVSCMIFGSRNKGSLSITDFHAPGASQPSTILDLFSCLRLFELFSAKLFGRRALKLFHTFRENFQYITENMSILRFSQAVHLLDRRLNSIRLIPPSAANLALSLDQLDILIAGSLLISLDDPELTSILRNPPRSISLATRNVNGKRSRTNSNDKSNTNDKSSPYQEWKSDDPLMEPICWKWALSSGPCATGDCALRNPRPHSYPAGTTPAQKKQFVKWLKDMPKRA